MSKMSKMLFSFLLNVMLSMSKTLKIDQIHLRAVKLWMSKVGKGHTHTFLLITFNRFSTDFQSTKKIEKLRLRAFQPYQILCLLKHVEDVTDRSSTLGGSRGHCIQSIFDTLNIRSVLCIQCCVKAANTIFNIFDIHSIT